MHGPDDLDTRDWNRIAAIYREWAAAGDAGTAAALRGLEHPRPWVRRMCADFFDHHGDESCVPHLRRVAEEDPIPMVRMAALHSLGCQRCKTAPLCEDLLPLFLRRAGSDVSRKVRWQAVHGIAQRAPDPRAAGALAGMLEEPLDGKMHRLVARTLRHHRRAEPAPA